jgi:hypothetical protein
MISRKTALSLADVVCRNFYNYTGLSNLYKYSIDSNGLYDFLYENDYPAWFCNMAQGIHGSSSTHANATRKLKEFIMRLHTGESLYNATKDWSWEQRANLGQEYIIRIIEDLIATINLDAKESVDLLAKLELDGYEVLDNRLLIPETDVLDVEEETGVILSLFKSLGLGNIDTVSHHLDLSEEHYLEQRWDDSIANSRKFMEAVLRESAEAHYSNDNHEPMAESIKIWPAKVRTYLEKEGLLDRKEKKMISSIYAVLSEKGAHPYMAKKDQARLLRHLALTISHFVLIRLKGSMNQAQV